MAVSGLLGVGPSHFLRPVLFYGRSWLVARAPWIVAGIGSRVVAGRTGIGCPRRGAAASVSAEQAGAVANDLSARFTGLVTGRAAGREVSR